MENNKIENSSRTVKMPIIIAVCLAIGIFIGAKFFGSKSGSGSDLGNVSSKFKEILMYIDKSYVDKVDTDSLANYGISKMLEKLDPHTSYLPPAEAQLAMSQLQNGFDGIGVEFNIIKDSLFVISPLSGGPSETVGIQTGDVILKANEVSLVGKDLNSSKVFENLRGPRGSMVKLAIKRKGFKGILNFNVKRDKIPTYSLDAAYLFPDKITGYIKINRFSETTYDEFRQNLEILKSQGMKQLLLDLRGNPGGYMDRATSIVDELVPGKDLILYTDGKDNTNDRKIFAENTGIFEKGAVVVLVDEGSASASEIVSGSLQDLDRAIVVGRRTFGKGLVQAPISLSDGSELRLTISRYYIPSGRSIQKPYQMGDQEEYYDELYERDKKGEFEFEDSIKNNPKLKFKTKSGRIVYGGGGVTPDLFVKRDTSYATKYLIELFAKNILREYALNYTTTHQKELLAMNYDSYFGSFKFNDSDIKEFINLGTRNGVKFDAKDFANSKAYILMQLKAIIARSVYKESAKKGLSNEYFKIVNAQDEMIKSAMTQFTKASKLYK